MNLIDREISSRIQLCRYYTYVDFTPVLLPSRVFRVFVLRIAAVHVSSRSDFCRVMEFRYIRCRIGSSIAVLSCQNNAGDPHAAKEHLYVQRNTMLGI